MSSYFEWLRRSGDTELRTYVQNRSGSVAVASTTPKSFLTKLRSVSSQKIYNTLFYIYLKLISHAFPSHIRSQVMVLTGLGERHRWMYDRVGLSLLLQKHGFHNITVCQPDTSAISNFNADGLDIEPDGTPYKRVSLYLEAFKP